MRTGGYTLQQTLTVEAASVLKHSLSLARRRGHAQITPLHVAATLLTLRSSLLRRACLKSQLQLLPHHQSTSHHHPLQCRALELCFNVALNRLPTTPAGPLLHGQPSISNALIAALKRAQAHQRRGCIEQQQQQPLLTIKVELEQLVISILDDPSVSRVMREAGFSSTAVKTHIEDSTATSSVFQCYTSTGGVFSSPCSPSPPETQRETVTTNFWPTHLSNYFSETNPIIFSPPKKVVFCSNSSSSLKQDIKQVLDVLMGTKKNIVIVGDSVSVTEGLVTELVGILEKGEVPNELKQTHFIKFNFEAVLSLRFLKREDVEVKVSELKRKVDSVPSGQDAIIYVGDLKWTVVEDEISGSSQVEHLVEEIGRLVTKQNNNSNTKLWVMGIATYQTYMRCQMRQPPLETQWALQVVSVPSAGLGLSLHGAAASSDHESKPFAGKHDQDNLICCAECYTNYEREAQIKSNSNSPPWLQTHFGIVNIQKDELAELRRKWSRLCHSHQGTHNQNHLGSTFHNNQDTMSSGKTYSCASSSPWWKSQDSVPLQHSDSTSLRDFDSRLNNKNCNQNVHKFRRQLSCEFNFSQNPSLDYLKSSQRKDGKITLALGNSFLCDSGKMEKQRIEMCKLLQENVSWQSEAIPSIVESLIESKSLRGNTLLLFQGNDTIGKRRLALVISESMFGSSNFVLQINMRKMDNAPFCEMLSGALRNKLRRVVLVEDADLADTQFVKLLTDGFESGNFGESIIILATGDSMTIEDNTINQESVIGMGLRFIERKPNYWKPNLESKRKAEWDFSSNNKIPRIEEKRDDRVSSKKDLSRQSSFNSLDLNIKANEEDDDEGEGKCDQVSPISSDITRETSSAVHTPDGLFKTIDKCFLLNCNATRDQEAKEAFLSKIKGSLKEVLGAQNVMGFSVEERVLEELVLRSPTFLNSLFDNWVKDIFQTSLQTLLKTGGKGGTGEIRVCFDGIRGKILEDGYTGTCLPKKIQISFRMD